jgi:hypothetical protein
MALSPKNSVIFLTVLNCSDKKTQGNQISTNTVWIVYELQLYLHLIEPLSTLYEYIYQENATEMFSFISSKSLEDLGVQEPWIRGTTVDNTEGNSLACEVKRNKCFKTNIALVSMKSGNTFTLLKLCENDEDLRCFFDALSSLMPQYFALICVTHSLVIRIALVMLRSFPIMLFDRIILSSSLLTGLNPAVTQSSVFNIPLEISSLQMF